MGKTKVKKNAQNKIFRVIDANLNRAKEGLRVTEDVSRFIFNNAATSKKLKAVRHSLDRISSRYYPELLSARDSDNDVGRRSREKKRLDLSSLLVANFRRIQEAMRVLEEFSKLISERAGDDYKKMRYTVYIVEKDMMKKIQNVS